MDRTLTMPRTIIGCDLSRAVLDLYSLPDAASTQVVNDPDDRRLWGGGRKIREALYIADLLAVAADAASNDEDVPDTFPAEARLAINLILSRTDD